MRLSMLFLQYALGEDDVCICLNGYPNPSFSKLRILCPGMQVEAETLYVCDASTQPLPLDEISSCQNCGIAWAGERHSAPLNLPVITFNDTVGLCEIANKLLAVFDGFNEWSARFCEALLDQGALDSALQLLCEVTPNAWYLSDTSFRIISVKEDADLEEMSSIWKFLYKERHLPIHVVMALTKEGLLDQMNQQTSAYIPPVPPFNMPFVSKTVLVKGGIFGHFFIIGVYNRLTAYEIEIAEYVGSMLSKALASNPDAPSNQGRIYDNYFIDLIEGTDQHALERIDEIADIIGWDIDDEYVMTILRYEGDVESAKLLSILCIHVLEREYDCRCFLYKGEVVTLFNLAGATRDMRESILDPIRILERTHEMRDRNEARIGMSETFRGRSALVRLRDFYNQAAVALSFAGKGANGKACRFENIAVAHMVDSVSETLGSQFICHPALALLRAYDEGHHSSLYISLRAFLNCHQNIADASRSLYVHRNTLVNRLSLISSLIDLDLKDPETCLWLMMSYRLADGAKGAQGDSSNSSSSDFSTT